MFNLTIVCAESFHDEYWLMCSRCWCSPTQCINYVFRKWAWITKKYAPLFTHYFEAKVGRGCLLNYSISLVYNFMPPPHLVPRYVTHYIGRQSWQLPWPLLSVCTQPSLAFSLPISEVGLNIVTHWLKTKSLFVLLDKTAHAWKNILSLHCTLYIRLCVRKHAYAI